MDTKTDSGSPGGTSPPPTTRQLGLPLVRAIDLPVRPPGERWMVEGLIAREACVIIGGPPKAYKTWLALDLTVSAASSQACLGKFNVQHPGEVLVYMAEDPGWAVRERLASICRHRGLALEDLPIHVITAPRVLLDTPEDQARLAETVDSIAPKMIVLDPFVRLTKGVDENHAGQVSQVLSYLRGLSREHDASVVLTHHTRKQIKSGRAAESLRGSSDFFAWADAVITCLPRGGGVSVEVDHRFSRSPEPFALRLVGDPDAHPEVVDLVELQAEDSGPRDLRAEILELLAGIDIPPTGERLRTTLQCKNKTLSDMLHALESEGLIEKRNRGWALADKTGETPDGRTDPEGDS